MPGTFPEFVLPPPPPPPFDVIGFDGKPATEFEPLEPAPAGHAEPADPPPPTVIG